jgi:cytochrome d ubiquinol oxidase subunit II
VWDGNETWLVFGGGGLFAMFPLAYAVICRRCIRRSSPLLALVFRGSASSSASAPASERARGGGIGRSVPAPRWRPSAKAWCSVDCYRVSACRTASAGGWWDWLTGFTVCAASRGGRVCVAGRVLADLAVRRVVAAAGAPQYARALAVAMLGFIVVVSIWTPLLNPVFAERWFGWPGIVLTSPVPILVALVGWLFWRGLSRRDQVTPLLCAQAWFALCYAGLGISLWPMIVPPGLRSGQAGITIWIWPRTGPIDPSVPFRWRGGADPNHPGLYRLCLHKVFPRQGAAGNALSLVRRRDGFRFALSPYYRCSVAMLDGLSPGQNPLLHFHFTQPGGTQSADHRVDTVPGSPSLLHRSCTSGQRGWKQRQPGGMFADRG